MSAGRPPLPEKPRPNRFVVVSAALLLLLVGAGLARALPGLAEVFEPRRRANLARFFEEIRPEPLRGREFDLGIAVEWAGNYLSERGLEAAGVTLAISVAAIVIAGFFSFFLAFPAARTIACPEPFAPAARPPGRSARLLWRIVPDLARIVFVFLRALPEYVWAFLLLLVFGPSPWAAVTALVIHNTGILARLFAETIENLPGGTPGALRAAGAGRLSAAAVGVIPSTVPRFLLYFFYRWESCVREATVLGMLGIVSLGYWILDARSRHHQDEMLLLVLLGSAIVLAGDLVSAVARRLVRRAA